MSRMVKLTCLNSHFLVVIKLCTELSWMLNIFTGEQVLTIVWKWEHLFSCEAQHLREHIPLRLTMSRSIELQLGSINMRHETVETVTKATELNWTDSGWLLLVDLNRENLLISAFLGVNLAYVGKIPKKCWNKGSFSFSEHYMNNWVYDMKHVVRLKWSKVRTQTICAPPFSHLVRI